MSYCIRLSSKKNLQTAFGMPLDGLIEALGVDYSIFLMMRYNELEGDVGSSNGATSKNVVDKSSHI
ncbi:hypothetical protein NYE25_09800 [Paenibacillus sp. FSL E2-8871]|uniref:hypothetical protein n=1 Tax=Paenibacillus sp. FSL E2-8871 TaxID=2975326 RepID=UPI000F8FC5B3